MARPVGDAIDPGSLHKLVAALAACGHLRAHWDVDEAVDAFAVLTSYATYERLRNGTDDNGARVPEEVEALVAKLAVSIVSPGGNPARGAEQRMPVGG